MSPRATLLQGDCLELMRDLPDSSVDMVLADLPYGTTQNRWDGVIPFAPLWDALLRVGKPNAAFVFTASQPFTSALVMSRPDLFRHEWIWIKNRGGSFFEAKRAPRKEHESVLIFSRGGWTYNGQPQERTGGGKALVGKVIKAVSKSSNYGAYQLQGGALPELRCPSSWQKINVEVGQHPTQKPVALGEYLIRTYSNAGEVVLDPTMGSASFGVAALNIGRRFIGMEKDAAYFATAQRRIDAVGVVE